MFKRLLTAAAVFAALCGPAAAQTVKTLGPDVKGADVISHLGTKAYKGQVVLVDVWATWCGPCRAAMKEVDAFKPTYAEKGVKFVYLTGETSPEADWNAMIKTIEGDHFRLTKTQWEEMCKALKLVGIPTYLIIGRDGKVAYSNATEGGYPGTSVIEEALDRAL